MMITTTTRMICLLWACRLALSRSYVMQPGTWKFQGHPIAYERSQAILDKDVTSMEDSKKDSTPVLLLNGFGVGSFHQHRLVHELVGDPGHVGRSIYTIDYLGQGKSWPVDCQDGQAECEAGLRYSAATWLDQICGFIEEVILPSYPPGTQVHLVGNSVGGYLATFVAASRPDLVQSLSLLNATPVWGLNLPGWDGTLPAPWLPKLVGRYLFDRIRDLNTIEQYLRTAYGNHKAFDTELMQQIRQCTEGPGGHAAFASILWSPPLTIPPSSATSTVTREILSFYDALQAVDCNVLLLFGAADPWCKPAFAKRMLQRLDSRTKPHHRARYVEVAGVGHCPNHEAPKATALVLNDWWSTADQSESSNKSWREGPFSIRESWGETTLQERTYQEIPLSLLDRLAVMFV